MTQPVRITKEDVNNFGKTKCPAKIEIKDGIIIFESEGYRWDCLEVREIAKLILIKNKIDSINIVEKKTGKGYVYECKFE
jgi:hypothetical protein